MNEKIIDRLYQYLDYKGIKKTRFEKEIGLSNGYLGTQKRRNADLGEGVIQKIIDNSPDLSVVWFVCGNGEMLNYSEETMNDKVNNSISLEKKDSQIKQRLLNYLKHNQVDIDTFCLKTSFSKSFLNHNYELSESEIIQIATTFDELNLEWLLLGKGQMNKQVVAIDNDAHISKIQELMSVIRDKDKIIKLQEKLLSHDCIDEKIQNAG